MRIVYRAVDDPELIILIIVQSALQAPYTSHEILLSVYLGRHNL